MALPENWPNAVADALIKRNYNKPRGLSARQLAERCGVSQGTLQRRARIIGCCKSKSEAAAVTSERTKRAHQRGDLQPWGRTEQTWISPENDAYIRLHYNVDMTVAQIALAIGVRRSQVASRAQALRIQKSRYHGEGRERRSARLDRMARAAARVEEAERSEAVSNVPGQPYSPAPPRSAGPALYRIGGTSPWRTCQWIESNKTKCGCESVPGYSWCEHHYSKVFQGGTGRRAA